MTRSNGWPTTTAQTPPTPPAARDRRPAESEDFVDGIITAAASSLEGRDGEDEGEGMDEDDEDEEEEEDDYYGDVVVMATRSKLERERERERLVRRR